MNVPPSPPDGPPPLLDPQPAAAVAVNRRRWWIHLFLITAYTLLIGVLGRLHREAHTHFPALSHTSGGLLLVFDATSLALLPWLAEKLPEIQRTLGH